jgi:hypothetical protein
MWTRLICIAAAGAAIAALGAAPAGASSFRTGFTDDAVFQSPVAADRAAGFQNARATRASLIRLFLYWSEVAPSPPPSRSVARDPAWSGYRWGRIDGLVTETVAAGLQPVVTWLGAPGWAEGTDRPPVSERVPVGTWRPSPSAYRDFSEAAARRYSGLYADPRTGALLPRIRYWQGWNEPNLANYLNPQWRREGGRLVPASPAAYRRLLNAFYRGVKAVSRRNVVITAGTAPFGDHRRGAPRMDPAYFAREFLCVRGRVRPRAERRCQYGPVRFDALAHHPYPIGPPRRVAPNRDDVVVPDLWKLTRPLRVAVRAGHVKPRGRKGLWATEISWDTRPPDPDGLPLKEQAYYLRGALYTLWRQGVDAVTWYLMRDEPEGRGWQYGLQAGVYFRGDTVAQDRRKPHSFRAFSFPFSAYRDRGVAQLWGLAPRAGRVAIQRLEDGRWLPYLRLRTRRRDRLFFAERRVPRGTVLRARQGREASLSWRVSPNITE